MSSQHCSVLQVKEVAELTKEKIVLYSKGLDEVNMPCLSAFILLLSVCCHSALILLLLYSFFSHSALISAPELNLLQTAQNLLWFCSHWFCSHFALSSLSLFSHRLFMLSSRSAVTPLNRSSLTTSGLWFCSFLLSRFWSHVSSLSLPLSSRHSLCAQILSLCSRSAVILLSRSSLTRSLSPNRLLTICKNHRISSKLRSMDVSKYFTRLKKVHHHYERERERSLLEAVISLCYHSALIFLLSVCSHSDNSALNLLSLCWFCSLVLLSNSALILLWFYTRHALVVSCSPRYH